MTPYLLGIVLQVHVYNHFQTHSLGPPQTRAVSPPALNNDIFGSRYFLGEL